MTKLEKGMYGKLTAIDIYECDLNLITNPINLQEYIDDICDLIKMKKWGESHIKYFGSEERLKGYSIFQFIETSSINGHFSNQKKEGHIDIFSCADYDSELSSLFTKNFFKAKKMKFNVLLRF